MQRVRSGEHKNCTGRWTLERPIGRPKADTTLYKRRFEQFANFIFDVVASSVSMSVPSGHRDPESGWVIRVTPRNGDTRTIHMRASRCSSRASIAREIAERVPGAVSNISSVDFLQLVEEDVRSAKRKLPVMRSVDQCGYFAEADMWVFPGCTLDGTGKKCDSHVFLTDAVSRSGMSLTRCTAPIASSLSASAAELSAVCGAVARCYGPARMHAMHVLSMAWKAVHRQRVMESESCISVCNISGPPNVGKTFISAVTCALLGCDAMIISRATQSAMLDYAHFFRNLIVIWDDPRDVAPKVMEAVVHEAFHGHASSTMKHGERRYNSTLVIGTQTENLGIAGLDSATCSRLTHIDFAACSSGLEKDGEQELKSRLSTASRAFACLLGSAYDRGEVDAAYADLKAVCPDVIDRSVRSLAVDVVAMTRIGAISCAFSKADVLDYVREYQLPCLQRKCNTVNVWDQFSADVESAYAGVPNGTRGVKRGVRVSIGKERVLCDAYYIPEIVDFLRLNGVAVQYGTRDIQNAARKQPSFVSLTQNVNYSGRVHRSLAMRSTQK